MAYCVRCGVWHLDTTPSAVRTHELLGEECRCSRFQPYSPSERTTAARCMDCDGWLKRPPERDPEPASRWAKKRQAYRNQKGTSPLGGRPPKPRTKPQVRDLDFEPEGGSGPVALATAENDSRGSQRDWQESIYSGLSMMILKRRQPSKLLRDQILEAQGGRCFYCRLPFGGVIYRGHKPVSLQLHWDHVVPFSYSRNNRPANFVAACHVCNGIKGDLMFDTPAKAAAYIEQRRIWKGYRLTPPI